MNRVLFCLVCLAACDKGGTTTPAIVTQGILQPPLHLVTVTGDSQIQLRWLASNVEPSLQGYQVFAAAHSISDFGTPAYPSSPTIDLTVGSIPRCYSNSPIFEAFGMPAAKTVCDSGTGNPTGSSDAISGFVSCVENTGSSALSLAVSPPANGWQTCTVTALSDKTSLSNGTTYTFFVMAVGSSTATPASWTSNFVQDTPTLTAFNSTVTVAGTDSGAVGSYFSIPTAKITAFTAFTSSSLTTGLCSAVEGTDGISRICKLNETNDATTDGVYFGRLGNSSTNPQQLVVSVPSTSSLALLPRGTRTTDPQTGKETAAYPGDAASTGTYSQGTVYAVNGDEVFDMKISASGNTYYGKLVVGTLSLQTATDATSTLSVPLTVVVQTKASTTDY